MFLLPNELIEYGVTSSVDEKGCIVSLQKDGIVIDNKCLGAVIMSWNAYKKADAQSVVVADDSKKALFTIPRVKVEEVEKTLSFEGEDLKVQAWRVSTFTQNRIFMASPETILSFLALDCVGVSNMQEVATAVENAIPSNSYKQLDASNYDTPGKIALIVANPSLPQKLRDLSGLLLGLLNTDGDMDDKIAAFQLIPSVTFAAAANFYQSANTHVVNVSTKSFVKLQKLVDLDDKDPVIMTKVVINDDFWNTFSSDISNFMVYKFTDGLALKKKGNKAKMPMQTMRFETMEASHLKAIYGTICKENTTKQPPAENVTMVEKDENDELYNDIYE
jgi:hypothetical protein